MVADVIFGIIAEENMALLICLSAPGTGPLAAPLHTVRGELHLAAVCKGKSSTSPGPCLGN